MQMFSLFAVSSALLIVCGALCFVIREIRSLRQLVQQERDHNEALARVFHQVDDLLTSARWHNEMLMDQESGKLNIAQQQLINKIGTSVDQAESILKEEYKFSSKHYKKNNKEKS